MRNAPTTFLALYIPALFLVSAFAFTSVHAQSAAAEPTTDNEQSVKTLATVNGRSITQLSVDNVAQQIQASGQQVDEARILEELINLEVMTQAAEALNLDTTPEIAAALQLQYTQTMANAYLASESKEVTVTDEQMRKEYDTQAANVDRAEYRASHILLENQEDAANVISEINNGKTFEELAKERSIDPSGENGGDLGWFQSANMPPELIDAVKDLQINSITPVPVKTEYGFHVIKLVDRRDAALPDFDAVKPGLKNLIERQILAQKVEELRAKAEIVIK